MKILKVVLLGPSYAGKSELAKRLVRDSYEYREQTEPTIGADGLIYRPNPELKLYLWDTAGAERFKSLLPGYCRNTDKLCLVIPADKPLNIAEILSYVPMPEADKIADILLIITKTDLGISLISDNDIKSLSEALEDMDYSSPQVFRVSAKENTEIEELRQNLIMPVESSENLIQDPPVMQFPKSYGEITEPYSTAEAKAIALLRDYTKGTTPGLASLSLLSHGHFNRHHTSIVRALLRDLDNKSGNNDIRMVVGALVGMPKSPEGSLARRLRYIEQELGLTSSQEPVDIRTHIKI